MQGLGLDKTTNMLLQMVVMFSSDLAGLTEPDTISCLQVSLFFIFSLVRSAFIYLYLGRWKGRERVPHRA